MDSALKLELVPNDFLARKNKVFNLNHRFFEKNCCLHLARDLRVVECVVPFSANFFEFLGPPVSCFMQLNDLINAFKIVR